MTLRRKLRTRDLVKRQLAQAEEDDLAQDMRASAHSVSCCAGASITSTAPPGNAYAVTACAVVATPTDGHGSTLTSEVPPRVVGSGPWTAPILGAEEASSADGQRAISDLAVVLGNYPLARLGCL